VTVIQRIAADAQNYAGPGGARRRYFALVMIVSFPRAAGVVLALLALLMAGPAAAQGAPPVRVPKNALKNLEADLERLRQTWHVPGLAVAIVSSDRVLFAKGFGERDVVRHLPVTPNTLFGIASCSKSLGAATVCLLAQDGLLDLDAPIHSYWPAFQLQDEYATLRVTARDLLSHRWGLPRHDLVWYHHAGVTRAELVRRLRYLAPISELRSTFHYQNLGYTTLSQLVEQVSPDHATWETVAQRRLLGPLGMTRTNFSVHVSERDPDHAIPYRLKGDQDELERLPLADVDVVGAAVNVNSTATDMARWVRATLTDGTLDGKNILPADALHQTHEPQMAYDLRTPDDDVYTDTYGMGWVIGTYRGYRFLTHSGSIDGFTSEMAALPAEGVGVVVLTNLDDTEIAHLITNTVLDRLTGLRPIDWSARYLDYQREEDQAISEQDSIADPFRVPNTRPSHLLAAYAGRYRHPAYGSLTLRPAADGRHLVGDLHGLRLTLTHYHYETFATDATDLLPDVGPDAASPGADPVPVSSLRFTFETDPRGDIGSLSVALEPDAEPLTFERLPDTLHLTRAQLQRFVGTYGPSARETFRVELPAGRGDTLRLQYPDQPAYPLLPVRPNEFSVRGLPGYLLRFVVPASGAADQPATEILTIQPEGVLRDRRRPE
jgi:CubicO group peptidase (beta-lactamase class C family)